MSDEAIIKTIGLAQLTSEMAGDRELFETWMEDLCSYAGYKNFLEALSASVALPDTRVNPDTMPTSDDQERAAKKAVKENDLAMVYLNASVRGGRPRACIQRTKSSEYPCGIAHEAVTNLKNKFAKTDAFAATELRTKLSQCKMIQGDHPSKFFDRLTIIKEMTDKLSADKITLSEFVSQVFKGSLKEYLIVLRDVKRANGSRLTLDDLEEEVLELYRLQHMGDDDEDEENNETSLATPGAEWANKTFKGKCYKCHKEGHRAFECPEKRQNQGQRGHRGSQQGKRPETRTCHKCGLVGHLQSNCWEDEKNARKRPSGWTSNQNTTSIGAAAAASVTATTQGYQQEEFLLMAMGEMKFPDSMRLLSDPNIWIADTGATTDSTGFDYGVIKTRAGTVNDQLMDASGKSMPSTVIGNLPVTKINCEGKEEENIVLQDVNVVPTAKYNLFSVTKRTKEGWELQGNKEALVLKKGNKIVKFDIILNSEKGLLYCGYFKRRNTVGERAFVTADGNEKRAPISVSLAHQITGHMGEEATRAAVKEMGIKLTRGKLKPCVACGVAKAQQKSVKKASTHEKATRIHERVYLDISTIKPPRDLKGKVTKQNWRLIVDERTGIKYSDFFSTKDGMVVPTCERFLRWKQAGVPVANVRCDNAGENIALETKANSNEWQLNVRMEYTGAATPQRNSLVEVGFATLMGRSRALMYQANVPQEIRYKVVKEVVKTATLLDGLTVIEIDGKKATRYVHRDGKNPGFVNHLRTWGEAGIVKTKGTMTPKLKDRGVPCMLVGYNPNSGGDVYRMWNPTTNRVHNTRDVLWLKRMYYQPPANRIPPIEAREGVANDAPNVGLGIDSESDDDDDDDEMPPLIERNNKDSDSDSDSDDDDDQEEAKKETRTRSGRKSKAPTRLIEMSNVGLTHSEANYFAAMINASILATDGHEHRAVTEVRNAEIALVGAGLGGGFQNTKELRVMKYDEAMESNDRAYWENAADEEHDKMQKFTVWTPRKLRSLPPDAKIITSTWAMKKKASGIYRARLNARGFEQVNGIHFNQENIASPVTNDMSIRIVMVLALMAGWISQILDVKGAFLHGEFEEGEEPIYMEVPQGFEKYYGPDVVLLLLKTIYGLKQAAKAFWTELLKAFGSMGCERSKADPCMYYQWTVGGSLMVWLSWIDDCVCFGEQAEVEKSRDKMKQLFDCDDVGDMNEYVGCKIDKENGAFKFTQPVMVQSFEDEFELPNLNPATPGEPGVTLAKAETAELVGKDETKYYRKGIGKLLHMMRWSRPDIYNSVRDLSRHMSGVAIRHIRAMHRVMKHVVSTRDRGWVLKPNRKWDGKDKEFEFIINGMSDSDYAACKRTRRSVSGYAVMLEGAPINTKSTIQKTVALSVTEAEMNAGVSCVQDMLYAKKILESLELKVKLPMLLEMDNKGAVDMANNWSVGGRTRHMETRQLFMRELKEQGILEIKWKAGALNPADLFTKNLGGPDFRKHIKVFCGKEEK